MTLLEQFKSFSKAIDEKYPSTRYTGHWSIVFCDDNLIINRCRASTTEHLHFFIKNANFVLMAHLEKSSTPITEWEWEQSGPFVNNQLEYGFNRGEWQWKDSSIKGLKSTVHSSTTSLMLFNEIPMIRELAKYLIEN